MGELQDSYSAFAIDMLNFNGSLFDKFNHITG
ncbi:hypothetical protein BROOK1789B_102 [Bathymodiolus brooksi thiotrophic gill symbiont]|nr:hypothetical protein BROOK1789B_102 [Bathymodiolus brooksi thiotrophic gill symbiont]